MTSHWTEARIREVLDGTFTRVLFDGRTITLNVDNSFTPSLSSGGRPHGYKAETPQTAWTKEEDDILIRGRILGKPFNELAWILARTEDSAKKRHRVLRVRGVVR